MNNMELKNYFMKACKEMKDFFAKGGGDDIATDALQTLLDREDDSGSEIPVRVVMNSTALALYVILNAGPDDVRYGIDRWKELLTKATLIGREVMYEKRDEDFLSQ